MGYYTDFELDVVGDGPIRKAFEQDVEDEKIEAYGGPFRYLLSGDAREWKWYDHDKEMDALSEKYPNLLFVLTGVGEEKEDYWRTWYRNGKHITVTATITYPEPDLSVLPIDDEAEAALKAEAKAKLETKIARLQRELDALGS